MLEIRSIAIVNNSNKMAVTCQYDECDGREVIIKIQDNYRDFFRIEQLVNDDGKSLLAPTLSMTSINTRELPFNINAIQDGLAIANEIMQIMNRFTNCPTEIGDEWINEIIKLLKLRS
jgi:hypothetical protein